MEKKSQRYHLKMMVMVPLKLSSVAAPNDFQVHKTI